MITNYESCCHVVGLFSAVKGWFSHSGSPQTERFAVRASASGTVAGTSLCGYKGIRTVTPSAVAVAGGWSIDGL